MPDTISKHNGQVSSEDTRSSLIEFFVNQVRDLYWAKRYVVKSLPKMRNAAASIELRDAFEKQFQQAREHIIKLEHIFDLLDEKCVATKCDDMECLVEEEELVVAETEDGSPVREIGLIFSAQKIKHHEIASYEGLVQLAKILGLDEIQTILEETLSEEKAASKFLNRITESISYEANNAMFRWLQKI